MIDLADLLALVPEHLGRQRWYDHERPPATVDVAAVEQWRDGDPSCWWMLVDASDETGAHLGRYQLVVGARPADPELDFVHGKDVELLGGVSTDDHDVVVYDAVIDVELAVELLGRVVPGRRADTARPLLVEQSNSSVVFDEQVIVKVFRRVHDGDNPDVDAVARLVERGYAHVPAQHGVLSHDGAHLAVARDFLTAASDGWHLALGSLRVLFADHTRASASGGDFGPDAARLGAITAELHLALADAYGTSTGDLSGTVAHFRAQLDRVRDHVPADAISARYDAVARLSEAGPATRIHGDLHLGQLLRADTGWFVIDFEGEPARPLAERLAPSSPLRDVAGMLRSFHYAAEVARLEQGDHADDVAAAAVDWERRVRDAFLAAYRGTEGIDDLLPDPPVADLLLTAFELDKAVYETAYEVAFRPSWVGIPQRAIARLLT